MSFTVTTRRPRGLGVMSPFISTLTADAGRAIAMSIDTGRFNSEALSAPAHTVSEEPPYDSGPHETPLEYDLSCDCLAKRAIEGLTNLGASTPSLASAIAECEGDPDAFAVLTASLFGGEIPECAWYEERTKRNIAIGVGVLAVLGIGGVALAQRRRR